MSDKSMMILIAGPYRSGTGDDPARMAANLHNLEAVALPLYRAGHIPMIGEWVALPLLQQAGQPASATRSMTKSSIRSPIACSPIAMQSSACRASPRAPMRMCVWPANAACPSISI